MSLPGGKAPFELHHGIATLCELHGGACGEMADLGVAEHDDMLVLVRLERIESAAVGDVALLVVDGEISAIGAEVGDLRCDHELVGGRDGLGVVALQVAILGLEQPAVGVGQVGLPA